MDLCRLWIRPYHRRSDQGSLKQKLLHVFPPFFFNFHTTQAPPAFPSECNRDKALRVHQLSPFWISLFLRKFVFAEHPLPWGTGQSYNYFIHWYQRRFIPPPKKSYDSTFIISCQSTDNTSLLLSCLSLMDPYRCKIPRQSDTIKHYLFSLLWWTPHAEQQAKAMHLTKSIERTVQDSHWNRDFTGVCLSLLPIAGSPFASEEQRTK